MAHLSIRLLGGFQVNLDDAPVDGFRTQKARALLAYLAAEAGRVYTRASLSGLLWPEQPDATARTYLRGALVDLRAALDDQRRNTPFLLATAQTLQLNPAADHWIDVAALRAGVENDTAADPVKTVARVTGAVDLYRGRFLEGFFLKGNTAFEEWQLLTAESIQRQVVGALAFLAAELENAGDHASALGHAWQRAELEPLSDEANRDIMRLLVAAGDSNAALAHYDRFAILLADDLESTPAPETVRLADQIAAGQAIGGSRQAEKPLSLPPFLADISPREASTPFVARADELARLHEKLETAIAGQGQVLFVAGDAGQGKTALMRSFALQAVARHGYLIAVNGSCTNFRGIGDPYLPFREILAQLSGDFVAQWEAGGLSRERARRLWQHAPSTVDAMLTQGPDLIDTLVPATGLLARVAAMPDAAERQQALATLLHQRRTTRLAGAQQQALFDQCTRVLQAIAREQPLLLLLDDLHWGDLGSLALLFHLGQRLDGCQLLIVGAYRPEEVTLGREGSRHPLERLVPEFQQRYGDITIDLNEAQGRDFVEAYVNLEPNQLGQDFRDRLLERSGGNPLYTVELLQDMRMRGALVQDESGRWRQHHNLDWHTLPVRIEATVGRRIARLPPELRSLLEAAAVQGGEFNVTVTAAMIGETDRDTMRMLKELERRFRLITPHGSTRLGGKRLVYCCFEHILFRQYIIDRLDDATGVALNEAVALALEALYADHPEERSAVAGQLAWHFREAEQPAKAARYYAEAGDAALRLYAYDGASAYYQNGLKLLCTLPDDQERHRLELSILIGFGAVRGIIDGGAAPGLGQIWRRARRLSEAVGDLYQRFQVLRYEWEVHFQRGEMRAALKQGEACLRVADEMGDYQLESHIAIGPTLYRMGKMVRAGRHFEQALALCTDGPEVYLSHLYTENPMVNALVNGSLVSWYLGYVDRARAHCAQAIAAANMLDHPYSLAFALTFATALYQRAAMPAETEQYARRTIVLSAKHGFALWSAVGNLYCGWARVAQGELAAGRQQTRDGLDAIRAAGMEHIRFAAVLADAYLRCSEIEASMEIVEDLLATIARTDEREWEAELHRLKGELLLAKGADGSTVERCYEQTVAVAAAQSAKSLELRATVSLARLLQAEGRPDEATARLTAIYDWFTEGFDTPDMLVAASMLGR